MTVRQAQQRTRPVSTGAWSAVSGTRRVFGGATRSPTAANSPSSTSAPWAPSRTRPPARASPRWTRFDRMSLTQRCVGRPPRALRAPSESSQRASALHPQPSALDPLNQGFEARLEFDHAGDINVLAGLRELVTMALKPACDRAPLSRDRQPLIGVAIAHTRDAQVGGESHKPHFTLYYCLEP